MFFEDEEYWTNERFCDFMNDPVMFCHKNNLFYIDRKSRMLVMDTTNLTDQNARLIFNSLGIGQLDELASISPWR